MDTTPSGDLFRFIDQDDRKAVVSLLKSKINPNEVFSTHGISPLAYAMLCQRSIISASLITFKADPLVVRKETTLAFGESSSSLDLLENSDGWEEILPPSTAQKEDNLNPLDGEGDVHSPIQDDISPVVTSVLDPPSLQVDESCYDMLQSPLPFLAVTQANTHLLELFLYDIPDWDVNTIIHLVNHDNQSLLEVAALSGDSMVLQPIMSYIARHEASIDYTRPLPNVSSAYRIDVHIPPSTTHHQAQADSQTAIDLSGPTLTLSSAYLSTMASLLLPHSIRNGNHQVVATLLQYNANPNVAVHPKLFTGFDLYKKITMPTSPRAQPPLPPRRVGNPLIHLLPMSIEAEYDDIALELIKAKADVNVKNLQGFCCLRSALQHGKLSLLRELLASPDIITTTLDIYLSHTVIHQIDLNQLHQILTTYHADAQGTKTPSKTSIKTSFKRFLKTFTAKDSHTGRDPSSTRDRSQSRQQQPPQSSTQGHSGSSGNLPPPTTPSKVPKSSSNSSSSKLVAYGVSVPGSTAVPLTPSNTMSTTAMAPTHDTRGASVSVHSNHSSQQPPQHASQRGSSAMVPSTGDATLSSQPSPSPRSHMLTVMHPDLVLPDDIPPLTHLCFNPDIPPTLSKLRDFFLDGLILAFSESDNLPVVDLLIEAGAYINARHYFTHDRPIHHAVSNINLGMTRSLLHSKASVVFGTTAGSRDLLTLSRCVREDYRFQITSLIQAQSAFAEHCLQECLATTGEDEHGEGHRDSLPIKDGQHTEDHSTAVVGEDIATSRPSLSSQITAEPSEDSFNPFAGRTSHIAGFHGSTGIHRQQTLGAVLQTDKGGTPHLERAGSEAPSTDSAVSTTSSSSFIHLATVPAIPTSNEQGVLKKIFGGEKQPIQETIDNTPLLTQASQHKHQEAVRFIPNSQSPPAFLSTLNNHRPIQVIVDWSMDDYDDEMAYDILFEGDGDEGYVPGSRSDQDHVADKSLHNDPSKRKGSFSRDQSTSRMSSRVQSQSNLSGSGISRQSSVPRISPMDPQYSLTTTPSGIYRPYADSSPSTSSSSSHASTGTSSTAGQSDTVAPTRTKGDPAGGAGGNTHKQQSQSAILSHHHDGSARNNSIDAVVSPSPSYSIHHNSSFLRSQSSFAPQSQLSISVEPTPAVCRDQGIIVSSRTLHYLYDQFTQGMLGSGLPAPQYFKEVYSGPTFEVSDRIVKYFSWLVFQSIHSEIDLQFGLCPDQLVQFYLSYYNNQLHHESKSNHGGYKDEHDNDDHHHPSPRLTINSSLAFLVFDPLLYHMLEQLTAINEIVAIIKFFVNNLSISSSHPPTVLLYDIFKTTRTVLEQEEIRRKQKLLLCQEFQEYLHDDRPRSPKISSLKGNGSSARKDDSGNDTPNNNNHNAVVADGDGDDDDDDELFLKHDLDSNDDPSFWSNLLHNVDFTPKTRSYSSFGLSQPFLQHNRRPSMLHDQQPMATGASSRQGSAGTSSPTLSSHELSRGSTARKPSVSSTGMPPPLLGQHSVNSSTSNTLESIINLNSFITQQPSSHSNQSEHESLSSVRGGGRSGDGHQQSALRLSNHIPAGPMSGSGGVIPSSSFSSSAHGGSSPSLGSTFNTAPPQRTRGQSILRRVDTFMLVPPSSSMSSMYTGDESVGLGMASPDGGMAAFPHDRSSTSGGRTSGSSTNDRMSMSGDYHNHHHHHKHGGLPDAQLNGTPSLDSHTPSQSQLALHPSPSGRSWVQPGSVYNPFSSRRADAVQHVRGLLKTTQSQTLTDSDRFKHAITTNKNIDGAFIPSGRAKSLAQQFQALIDTTSTTTPSHGSDHGTQAQAADPAITTGGGSLSIPLTTSATEHLSHPSSGDTGKAHSLQQYSSPTRPNAGVGDVRHSPRPSDPDFSDHDNGHGGLHPHPSLPVLQKSNTLDPSRTSGLNQPLPHLQKHLSLNTLHTYSLSQPSTLGTAFPEEGYVSVTNPQQPHQFDPTSYHDVNITLHHQDDDSDDDDDNGDDDHNLQHSFSDSVLTLSISLSDSSESSSFSELPPLPGFLPPSLSFDSNDPDHILSNRKKNDNIDLVRPPPSQPSPSGPEITSIPAIANTTEAAAPSRPQSPYTGPRRVRWIDLE